MNKTTAIFLVNDAVRCVSVAYDADTNYQGKRIPKDKKSFKTLDQTIQVDDLVIIPTDTRWGYTIGKVCEVDLHVDYDSPEQMRWIAAKFDEEQYLELIGQEALLMNKLADADREHRKRELRAKVLASAPDLSGINLINYSGEGERKGFEPPKRGGSQAVSDPQPRFVEDIF